MADAVDHGDPTHLAEELGDLLLQVLFHARIASEVGDFDIDDVAAALVAKLKRRHPHVFGDVQVAGPDEVTANWEAIKAAERAAAGDELDDGELDDDAPGGELAAALDRIPRGLAALPRATKTIHRLHRAGLDVAALAADLGGGSAPDGAAIRSAAGGALGAAVLAALDAGLDPDTELRRWTAALREAALVTEAGGGTRPAMSS